jgi:polygalacturonase
LLCFCGILNAAETSGQNCFNVRSFGAVGDGKHLDSPGINRAIDAAAKAGGGTVLVPAGTYLSGSIRLKSNMHLLIDAGATILGAPQSLNAYDETEPYSFGGYQDGGHCYFHNSLIWGVNLTNVFITGAGMINGGGLVHDDGLLDKMCGLATWNQPDAKKTDYPPVPIGNKAIALKLCKNVLIRDVTIFHGGHFAILASGCDNLTVDNVIMDTDRDGMDIDCCRDTIVSNCRINSPNDDGLCVKSTFALGEIRPTENLTIVNCQVSGFEEGTLLDGTLKPSKTSYGRIKFGTESSGGFRNCTVANCTFRNCHGLALEEVDGGLMEDISINNLTMMNVHYAIYLTTGKRNRTPDVTTNSRMKNILISNVIAEETGKMCGIQIMGLPEQPVEGIRLDNIRLITTGGGTKEDAASNPKELGAGYPEPGKIGTLPAYGIYVRHARDLELANINTSFQKTELRPAVAFADIDGLDIDHFKPQVSAGNSAAVIAQDVRGLAIRNSPMLEQGEKDSKPDSSGGLRGLPANSPQIDAPQSMRGDK